MPAPEHRPPGPPDTPELSPEEQGRLARAAALRPMNLIVLAVGIVFFVATMAWWLLGITLATYAALILLGTRDPRLRQRVLGREEPALLALRPETDVPPERRARWLPRGETRRKVEATLVEYRKVVAAIEDSDDVTRTVLGDTVPRLHAAADRLVDLARNRETAAETVRDLRRRTGPENSSNSSRAENLRKLEEKMATADAEISATSEDLLDLRARVVRISIDTDDADKAAALNASLDELNARLEALGDITSPQG